MNINSAISKFRVASRELFNQYFRVEAPYENGGWDLEEAFSEVEELLFKKMVTEPYELPMIVYRKIQSEILIKLNGDAAPWILNRTTEVTSGYWDHSIKNVSAEAKLEFVDFFDFDLLNIRDNRYVRVYVKSWPQNKEAENRFALVETQYVSYCKA